MLQLYRRIEGYCVVWAYQQFAAFIMIILLVNVCSLDTVLQSEILSNIGKYTKAIYILHLLFLITTPIVGEWFISYDSNAPIFQAMPQLLYAVPLSCVIIWLSIKLATIVKGSNLLSLLILGDMNIFENKEY